MTPVSPVDFTLRRTKQPFGSSPSFYTKDQQPKRSSMTRIVQTLIIEDLDKAEESIQTILLDLMVNKELYLSNIRYNVPKPFFLIITVLPHDFNRLSINSQLVKYNIVIVTVCSCTYKDG